eukprot:7383381-Alexandrium_andersonii.AAC.1
MAGWKCIYPRRDGEFEVRRKVNGVQHWLGLFHTLGAAKAALAKDLKVAVPELAQRSRAGPTKVRRASRFKNIYAR